MKTIRKRLTYANVISTLCLFLLLGGATAYAASKIGTNQLKGSSVTTGKIKNEAITTSKIKKGAVTGAKVNLGSLGTVPNATNATNAINATNATNAQPTAFAKVSAAGVLDAANSKNVGSVTKVGGGLYCFSGLPFAPRGGQATVDFAAAGLEYAQFEVGGTGGCPAGTQAAVFTTLSTGVTIAGFYVIFYQ